MKRLCIECQELIQGRTDKKFCNDVCRANFNNQRKVADEEFIKQINHVLKRNRKILKEKAHGKIKISKEALAIIGYDFNYFTHLATNENGESYFFCYEYGYIDLGYEKIQIVKLDEK